MNLTLLWMLLVPVLGAAVLFLAHRRTVGPAVLLTALPGLVVVGLVFAASYGSAVSDTEVWNGQVTKRERTHDTYEEPYECFCTTDSKGNRSCQTCYRTHYTVRWWCDSTVGAFTIDSADSLSRSVYGRPDPARWLSVTIGEPAARTHAYTNYVQAVPSSLFAVVSGDVMRRFQGLLPPYPINVYDHYRLDRFLTPGFTFTDAATWNRDISQALRQLGPTKQVNLIVVVAKTTDRAYAAALREAWEGVNKNDVVLVIGSPDGAAIAWVDVISWTKSELFKVQLIDRVQALPTVSREVVAIAADQIGRNFERRRMREFEYLKGDIDPPEWLLLVTLVALITGYGAGAWWLNRTHRRSGWWT